MRKIKTAQIFENNATKNLGKNSKRVSKNDNFEFKNKLNNAVKESNVQNQSPKDTLETTDKTTSSNNNAEGGKLENEESAQSDIKKEESTILENSANKYQLVVNSFQMDIKPIQVELLGNSGEAVSLEASGLKSSENLDFQSQGNLGLEKSSSDMIGGMNNTIYNQNNTADKMSNLNLGNVKLDTSGNVKLENIELDEQVESNTTNKVNNQIQVKSAESDSVGEDKASKVVDKTSKTDEFKFQKESKQYADENVVSDALKPVKTNELEVVKIKVGDGQQISSEKLIDEVAKNIILKSDSSNEYELQLDPENLGKIKVKLLFEEGKLTVSMLCSNGKTANLLSEGISNLTQVIQQSTRSEVAVNVKEDNYLNNNSEQNARQNSSNQQNQNQQKGQEEPEFADQIKLGLWEIENLKKQFATDFRFM